MNCLDYRRTLLAGEAETEAMRVHRLDCAACAAFWADQEIFEAELRRALAVAAPTALVNRLLAPLELTAPGRAALRRRWLAAAAVVVGLGGLGVYAWLDRHDALAMACIEFAMKDEAKSIMMGAMPRADAARALADLLPLERLERIGQIKHVAPCPFNGGTAYHIVLLVPQEKVTLLVMPGAELAGRKQATHAGFHASVVPLHHGSVGIVGASTAVVDSIAGALRNSGRRA